jgi:hypothetical protein
LCRDVVQGRRLSDHLHKHGTWELFRKLWTVDRYSALLVGAIAVVGGFVLLVLLMAMLGFR